MKRETRAAWVRTPIRLLSSFSHSFKGPTAAFLFVPTKTDRLKASRVAETNGTERDEILIDSGLSLRFDEFLFVPPHISCTDVSIWNHSFSRNNSFSLIQPKINASMRLLVSAKYLCYRNGSLFLASKISLLEWTLQFLFLAPYF